MRKLLTLTGSLLLCACWAAAQVGGAATATGTTTGTPAAGTTTGTGTLSGTGASTGMQTGGVGTTTLVNTAYAQGSNVAQVSDTAYVNVTRGGQSVSMSLTKMGRNLTRGQTGENSPVYASPGETIEFIIRVRNTSSSALTNVLVRDIVPQGIEYIPGTARLNGATLQDTLAAGGVNIGGLAVNQEAVILFSGRVAAQSQLPVGTTTLINTAQASADSIPGINAQLPVIISINGVVIPPVSTGPGESTVLALIVSAIITLLYVGYTGTDIYRRREVGELADQARKDRGLFNFRR